MKSSTTPEYTKGLKVKLSPTSEYASTLDIGPQSLNPRLAHPQGEQTVRSAFFLIWPVLVCPDPELERMVPGTETKSADQDVILSNEDTQLLKW